MIEAVCFDLGDTLIAEETIIRDSIGQAVTADVTRGALEVVKKIRETGYKLAIIANADSVDARNVINATGLKDLFDAIIISEEMGIEKPHREIFEAALTKLEVRAENAVMVGNRVNSDIVGANRLGMKSILFKWNNRYHDSISNEEEKPNFIIQSLFQLPGILSLL